MFGVSAALTTPMDNHGSINFDRLNNHIKTVLSEGCTSVTFFGTTGEGASVANNLQLETLRAAINANIDPGRFIQTLHGAAAADLVTQAKAALQMGVQRFLLPPPCYFSDPTDRGLFDWFNSILSQFIDTPAKFILYHIPQVIGVGLSVDLIKRLKAAYPTAIFGVKDSSGSFENTRELLQLSGLQVLVGDERLLGKAVKLGASGAISGIANLFAGRLCHVVTNGKTDPAINQLVDVILRFPVTPAIKALVAHKYGVDEWRLTAPPLVPISDTDYQTLTNAYDLLKASN